MEDTSFERKEELLLSAVLYCEKSLFFNCTEKKMLSRYTLILWDFLVYINFSDISIGRMKNLYCHGDCGPSATSQNL